MATFLNIDESTPAGECGLVHQMNEEPAIIDSQDSSLRQDIMKVQNSFSETHSMHGMDIAKIIHSNERVIIVNTLEGNINM